ncbi:MAG: S8 family serine peptidase, partial [Bacteroidota bacterium]
GCKNPIEVTQPEVQSKEYLLGIQDFDEIIEITKINNSVIPVFRQNKINADIKNHNFLKFEKAFPSTRYEYQKLMYLVKTSPSTITFLTSKYPEVFTFSEEIPEAIALYSPNDYGLVPSLQGQKDLDLIRAKDAWDITTGNSNTIIGITDTGYDLNHEDLVGKIINVRSNSGNTTHGTQVAGAAAAKTDNGKGIAGIGFNCSLDVHAGTGSSGANATLQMSTEGIRVVNSSWIFGTCSYSSYWQGVYNEIYENGTTVCFGAGNGASHCNFGATYPSALNHNIAVTSVGCDKPYGTISNWGTGPKKWNWQDVHHNLVGEFDPQTGAPIDCHNHYPEVDICAPGYTVRVPEPNNNYIRGWGTSFASPLVAGTIGLMLSTNPCLSPYQIEYGLKTTSVDIYGIPENQVYQGMLGEGRLDAAEAVVWASNFNCNDIQTATMVVKGIEINTICAPGLSSNGVNPTLIPIVEHGTPPFSFTWEALNTPLNETTLNNYFIEQPEIVSSNGTHLAHYRLTVYDSSPIQKVASKIIKIELSTNALAYDLAMRDSYVDMLDEPNDQVNIDSRDWNIWESPDIWNRTNQDNLLIHEDPEFSQFNPNYVYTKVRNVGCSSSPLGKELRLYWSKASTGEQWDVDWTVTDVIGANGQPVAAGREITTNPIQIPVIEPGDTWITNHPWNPIQPEAYDASSNNVDVCFLARIEETSSTPFGMTFPEIIDVTENIKSNNNIVTRNFIVTNLIPNQKVENHYIFLKNIKKRSQNFDLRFIPDKEINPHISGDFNNVANVKIYLGGLFEKWQNTNKEREFLEVNRKQRSVLINGRSSFTIENILLQGEEKIPIKIEFIPKDKKYEGIPFYFHFQQIEKNEGEGESIVGNITFKVQS